MNVFRFLMLLSIPAFSQPGTPLKVNNSSIAVSAVMAYDDGVAIEWSSRAFYRNNFCLRARNTSYWSEAYFATRGQWMRYNVNGVYIVYLAPVIDKMRVFTESGPAVFLLNKQMSDRPYRMIFHQSVGLDFFIINRPKLLLSYSFSLGGYIGHIHAEKIEGNPQLGQGITLNMGLKFYVRR